MIRAGAVIGLLAVAGCGGGAADDCIAVVPAENIIQLSFLQVRPPSVLGTCEVSGRIARVFAGGLERGADLVLELPCTGEATAALNAASVLELHLDDRLRLHDYAPYAAFVRNVQALTEATRAPVTPLPERICGVQFRQ